MSTEHSQTLTSPLSEREQELQRDRDWARNSPDIAKKYAGRVIAVHNRKVVAAAATLAELKEKLDRSKSKQPADRIVIVPINV
jgi:hypothetical protein